MFLLTIGLLGVTHLTFYAYNFVNRFQEYPKSEYSQYVCNQLHNITTYYTRCIMTKTTNNDDDVWGACYCSCLDYPLYTILQQYSLLQYKCTIVASPLSYLLRQQSVQSACSLSGGKTWFLFCQKNRSKTIKKRLTTFLLNSENYFLGHRKWNEKVIQ